MSRVEEAVPGDRVTWVPGLAIGSPEVTRGAGHTGAGDDATVGGPALLPDL